MKQKQKHNTTVPMVGVKTFTVLADKGCVKIYTRQCAFYLNNGYDARICHYGEHKVYIDADGCQIDTDELRFVDSFDIRINGKLNGVYLSKTDCSCEPLYRFAVGRWFVYNDGMGNVTIQYHDDRV